MSLKQKLYGVYLSETEGLDRLDATSEDYKARKDAALDFADRYIELEKIESDERQKALDREMEAELRLKQMADEKRGRMWRDGIAIVTFLGSLAYGYYALNGTWRFDADNTATSTNGRNILLNAALPKCLKM